MKLQTLILLFSLLLAGCAGSSSYLADKPILIIPETKKKSAQLQQQASQALLKALNRYHWQVRDINRADNIITAEACRGTDHCAEIQATVHADASVSIIRTPGQRLSASEGNMLRQWMRNLQREYKKNLRQIH